MNAKDMLQNLYDMLPETPECNAGCNKCCGLVIMLPIEAEILGLDECITPFDPDTLKCKFSVDNKCSVYENRPFTCRIFNASNCAPFRCPVMSKNGGLNERQVEILMARYFSLLAMCPESHSEAMQETIESHALLMIEHDARNGWIKENAITGEIDDNYKGDGS